MSMLILVWTSQEDSMRTGGRFGLGRALHLSVDDFVHILVRIKCLHLGRKRLDRLIVKSTGDRRRKQSQHLGTVFARPQRRPR